MFLKVELKPQTMILHSLLFCRNFLENINFRTLL